jgi:nitroreductase
MLQQLFEKARTIRRFYQYEAISDKDLISMINSVRLSPSPRNQQALKFILVNSEAINEKIFPLLAWAGSLKDWNGPKEGEKPAAYIIILGDNSIIGEGKQSYHEVAGGIASQSIILTACNLNIGACIIASVQRKHLRDLLEINDKFEIILVIAFGKAKEISVIESMPENGDFNYWRDDQGIHHVPKRSLEELIIKQV